MATKRQTKDVADTLKLWVVTSPSKHSTLGDVLFETTPRGLVLQGGGGLFDRQGADKSRAYVVAIYQNEQDANAHAVRLLTEMGLSEYDVPCLRCRTRINKANATQVNNIGGYICKDDCRV